MEYNLVFRLENIESPEERLKRAIQILTRKTGEDIEHPYINLKKLENIIISELSKTYMTRDAEKENKEGVFDGFTNVLNRVRDIILEINPGYPYPHTLVSTVILGAYNQHFFKEHIPDLTDSYQEDEDLGNFYTQLTLKAIKSDK
jgi:hypothetical protein